MFRSLLCVCTGNLCRSPMAERLLASRSGNALEIGSAGTGAPAGEPAAEFAVAALRERGIDLSTHRAREVTPELLQQSDLVLAADSGHVRELLRLAPSMRGRVYRLGHWRDVDIPDPIGGSREDFEECLALIEACVEDWMPHLLPASETRHG